MLIVAIVFLEQFQVYNQIFVSDTYRMSEEDVDLHNIDKLKSMRKSNTSLALTNHQLLIMHFVECQISDLIFVEL